MYDVTGVTLHAFGGPWNVGAGGDPLGYAIDDAAPEGSTWQPDDFDLTVCAPNACPVGHERVDGSCLPCADGTYAPVPGAACEACPEGQVPSGAKDGCEVIPLVRFTLEVTDAQGEPVDAAALPLDTPVTFTGYVQGLSTEYEGVSSARCGLSLSADAVAWTFANVQHVAPYDAYVEVVPGLDTNPSYLELVGGNIDLATQMTALEKYPFFTIDITFSSAPQDIVMVLDVLMVESPIMLLGPDDQVSLVPLEAVDFGTLAITVATP